MAKKLKSKEEKNKMDNMTDMGEKREQPSIASEGKQETKISYPGFCLKGDKIPEALEDTTPGQKCRLEIIVMVTSNGIDTYENNKPRIEVEIHKLGYIGKAGQYSKEEKMAMSSEEREKIDREEILEKDKEPEEE